MALQDAIASTYQTTGHIVRVNGQQVPDVLEVAVSAGFDQINANAQLTCAQRPAWAEEGAAVEVYAVINGYQALLFSGELSGVSWSFFPGTVVFDGRDLLSRTRLEWGGEDRIYADQDDAAVIRNLLEAMGIPSSQANIESSGWQLGIVQEVVLTGGDAAYSLIERIDSLSGYRTFSLSSGIIVRRRVDGRAAFSSAYSYTEGQNILSIRRKRTLDGIVNRADVTGLTYEGLSVTGTASAANPYIPDPPGTISGRIQDDLIETDTRANLIAAREVADKNQRPDGFELEVSINPLLQPGMTISISAGSVEAQNARVLIRSIRHSIGAGGATTTISTTGGNIAGYASGFPPVASFTVDLFRESLDTGGTAPTALIVGIADGSGSYDPDGAITAYSWSGTVYGGSINPPVGSEPVYRFTATGGSLIGITLDVTDDSSLHGTLVRDPLSLDGESLRYEAIYTAEDGVIAYSGDGQATWKEYSLPSGTSTALAPFAPSWGELWGASAGRVYISLDGLATPAQQVGTLGASDVTAVWAHEQDQTRVWAGLSNGAVYSGVFSSAGTVASVAWSLAGSIPGGPTINELRESYAAIGELWATAGTAMWRSPDSGASWAIVESGGTAWRMAAGWERNAAALLGDSTPVRYAEGNSPTFSPAITSVRGVSVGWKQPELYAADDSASAVLYLDEGFSGTATPAGTAPTQVNHLIRSGNEDRVVYLAGDNGGGTIGGVLKWIPEVLAPAYIRRTGSRSVRMVGYGTPVNPLSVSGRFTLVCPPFGAGGAGDQIWVYQNGVWVGRTPPSPNKCWFWIAANPYNGNEWLLFGNSWGAGPGALYGQGFLRVGNVVTMHDGVTPPLYHSLDAGLTWTVIPLPYVGADGGDLSLLGPRWSETNSGAWVIGAFGIVFPSFAPIAWRGSHAGSVVQTIYTNTNGRSITMSLLGPGDDLVYGETLETSAVGYAGPSDTALTVVATVSAYLKMIDRLYRSRAVVIVDGNYNVLITPDYRTTAPTVISSESGGWAVADYRNTIYVGERTGFQAITNPLTSPVITSVGPAGVSTGRPFVDRQTRTMIAAKRPTGDLGQLIDVYDGAQWVAIPPPLTSGLPLSPHMEIIAQP